MSDKFEIFGQYSSGNKLRKIVVEDGTDASYFFQHLIDAAKEPGGEYTETYSGQGFCTARKIDDEGDDS